MIRANFYRKNNLIYKFEITGHAGFAEEGSDIVCSAVTVLVINTINAIETFTDSHFECEADEVNGGDIVFTLLDLESDCKDHDAVLLTNTMYLGLKDIETNYGKYINITDKEVL